MRNAAQVAQKSGSLRMMLPSGLIFTLLAGGIALLLGLALGKLSVTYSALIAGLFLLLIIFLLKLDELTVVLIVAVHIFVDSYLAFDIYQVALLLTLTFFAIRYLGRSTKRPWSGPRAIGLWILFLALNIYPTLEGGDFSLSNSFSFYLNIVLSAFLLFWLGNMVARDVSVLRRIFQFLAILATLIAIHTLIEAITGTFLFQVAQPQYTTNVSASFQIPGANISRAGSFFGNPNGNAVFLATTFAFPLGLCIECKRPLLKLLYLLETLLILMALLFTYSTGAWLAVIIGWLVFMFLVGTKRRWISVLVLTLIVAGVASLAFSAQITALLSHASDNSDFSLHTADWQTTLRVIAAYPLFGVGLGNQAYLIRAEPYRVPAQYIPLAEPDNSFLQWGATSGIPTLLVFILLLGTTIWFAWRNWQAIDIRYRPLIASGIAALMVLSVNSLSADGWTDAAAMGYLGWLVAGLISSASLKRSQQSTVIPGISSASVELIETHKMCGVRSQPESHAVKSAETPEVQEIEAIQGNFTMDSVASLETRKIDHVQTKTFSVNRAQQDAEHK